MYSKIASVQSISGTGANHLGAMFTKRFYANDGTKVYIGTPAWGNYEPLFRLAGHTVEVYKAYDNIKKEIDFEAVLSKVRTAADGSIFVLQACCSNPTGADFSRLQWTQLMHEIQASLLLTAMTHFRLTCYAAQEASSLLRYDMFILRTQKIPHN